MIPTANFKCIQIRAALTVKNVRDAPMTQS